MSILFFRYQIRRSRLYERLTPTTVYGGIGVKTSNRRLHFTPFIDCLLRELAPRPNLQPNYLPVPCSSTLPALTRRGLLEVC